MSGVPNVFKTQIGPIPLSELDSDFESMQNTTDTSLGDALIGVKAPITGGIARTQHDKNQDTPSVADTVSNIDGVSDNTDEIKAAMAAYGSFTMPMGNYIVTSALSLRAYQNINGAGMADYLISVVPSTSNAINTRIIQKGAAAVFTTDTSPLSAQYPGRISLNNMTIQGRYNATLAGTYGVYIRGSQTFSARRLQATFFVNIGIYIAASVDNKLTECQATYCTDAGLDLQYNSDYTGGSYNAYMTLVDGGVYTQNANANIRLGTSAYQVRIRGADIESAGNYYPSGTGYGIHITGEARNVSIEGCWFEGNKIHIVVGPTNSITTVPQGLRIADCQLWNVTGGAEKIRLNSGRFTLIENNNFFGDGEIFIGPRSDAPIMRGNQGNPTITNVDGDKIAYNVMPQTGDFPNRVVSSWALSNCTLATAEIVSPAGRVPVYKVTPSAAGLVSVTLAGAYISLFSSFHTFGFWVKSDTETVRAIGWQVATTGGPTDYSDYAGVDQDGFVDQWKWVHFGRSVPSTDTGNFALALVVNTVNTDAFYISGFDSRLGIIHDVFPPRDDALNTLTDTATPSVYGLRTCTTGTSTTTVTDLSDGAFDQELTIMFESTRTITDGTNIFLAGSANFVGHTSDSLTLRRKGDGKWYEICRSVN